MSVTKNIEWDGYTSATIQQVYENGDVLCDLVGEGKSDRNISFPTAALPFTLTDEEINEISNGGTVTEVVEETE